MGLALIVIPWLFLALVPFAAGSSVGVVPVAISSVLLYCPATGIGDVNGTSYRRAVAPDGIYGRMNSTIWTLNRAAFFFGALLTSVFMTYLGFRLTLEIRAGVFVIAAAVVLFSSLHHARHEDSAAPC